MGYAEHTQNLHMTLRASHVFHTLHFDRMFIGQTFLNAKGQVLKTSVFLEQL